jgi:hypothetical protein
MRLAPRPIDECRLVPGLAASAKARRPRVVTGRHGLSERWACCFVCADLNMVYGRSRRPAKTELRTRSRNRANIRRRFGYRRLFIPLRREGEPSGINCIYRLYRE